jgi:hypothetical protein
MLDADYAADPRTVGFVPPVTAEQVLAFFGQVEPWIARARQAAANPDYRVDAEIYLPVDLPPWVEAEPCPRAHLRAMVAACRAIRERAEAAVADFERAAGSGERDDVSRLRQLLAEGSTAADYADGLLAANPDQALHEAIEERLHRALAAYYRLGQLAALPQLLDEKGPGDLPAVLAYPGAPVDLTAIDKWCLTDPNRRETWRSDPRAREAIEKMWAADPDPGATLAIQAEIDAAVKEGAIAHLTLPSGETIGSYYCCPWSAIYVVRRPVSIAGTRLRPMQQFTYDVSAEGLAEGEPFVRRVLISTFRPTYKVDYCDPESGHHD